MLTFWFNMAFSMTDPPADTRVGFFLPTRAYTKFPSTEGASYRWQSEGAFAVSRPA